MSVDPSRSDFEPYVECTRRRGIGFSFGTGRSKVHLVSRFFPKLDFRRVQVETEGLEMDDPSQYARHVGYGEELGRKLLADEFDELPMEEAPRAP